MGMCMNAARAPEEDMSNYHEVSQVPAKAAAKEEAELQEEVIEPVNSDLPFTEISYIQGALSIFLARKQTLSDIINISSDEIQVESATDCSEIPEKLLSPEAIAVLASLQPLECQKRVYGVVNLPQKRLPDGSIYIGQWAGKCQKGFGRYFHTGGSYAEGFFRDGLPHIHARLIASCGDLYEGDVKKGVKEGKGRLVAYENKRKYTGEWKGNAENGKGEEILSDGTKYTGDFHNGQKTGKGRFEWPDGSWYEGDLENGQLEGYGEYLWSDKKRYTGQWKDGKMNGEGTLVHQDGKMYKGSYVLDSKEGYGVYTWDGKTYEGQWAGNKMHGTGWLTIPGTGRKQYEFQNGKQVQEITT